MSTNPILASDAIQPLRRPIAYQHGDGVNIETISADKTLTVRSEQVQKLNGGVADRNVTLPAPVAPDNIGHWFRVYNSGSTNNLVVKTSAASTLATLLPGQYVDVEHGPANYVLTAKGGAGAGGSDFGAPGLLTDLVKESTAGAGVTLDESTATTGNAAVKLADNLASAWVIKEDSNVYLTFCTTDGAEAIKLSKALKVDSIAGLTGTTGTFIASLADNLADALSISEGATPYVTFVTTDGAEAVNIKKRLTTMDGVSSGIAKVVGGRAYSQTAASTAITGATETSTIFDTNISLPANTLKAGSVIRFSAFGKYTATTGAETHTLAYQVGSVVVGITGNLDPATNDYFHIMGELTCRTAGGSGTCVGWVRIASGASGASGTPLMYYLGSTTIDTTAANICGVYVDRQGTATDSDSMRLDHHVVEVS